MSRQNDRFGGEPPGEPFWSMDEFANGFDPDPMGHRKGPFLPPKKVTWTPKEVRPKWPTKTDRGRTGGPFHGTPDVWRKKCDEGETEYWDGQEWVPCPSNVGPLYFPDGSVPKPPPIWTPPPCLPGETHWHDADGNIFPCDPLHSPGQKRPLHTPTVWRPKCQNGEEEYWDPYSGQWKACPPPGCEQGACNPDEDTCYTCPESCGPCVTGCPPDEVCNYLALPHDLASDLADCPEVNPSLGAVFSKKTFSSIFAQEQILAGHFLDCVKAVTDSMPPESIAAAANSLLGVICEYFPTIVNTSGKEGDLVKVRALPVEFYVSAGPYIQVGNTHHAKIPVIRSGANLWLMVHFGPNGEKCASGWNPSVAECPFKYLVFVAALAEVGMPAGFEMDLFPTSLTPPGYNYCCP